MSWTVEWDELAEQGLRELGRERAERIDAAVMEYARTGRGLVFRVSRHDHQRLQVVVPGAVAYVFADERDGVLWVHAVYARPVLKGPR